MSLEDKMAEVDYLSSKLPVVLCPYCWRIVDEKDMVNEKHCVHCD